MDNAYLTLIGLNHNTAPVEIREKMFIQESDVPSFLAKIKTSGTDESVILSTCNRTEIYFHALNHEVSLERTRKILCETLRVQPEWLDSYTYVYHNEDACRHLFLVASGLDSLVLGEPEILGQVKDAYRIAGFHNATGFFLNKVFHKAFNVAKRTRTETRIGYKHFIDQFNGNRARQKDLRRPE